MKPYPKMLYRPDPAGEVTLGDVECAFCVVADEDAHMAADGWLTAAEVLAGEPVESPRKVGRPRKNG